MFLVYRKDNGKVVSYSTMSVATEDLDKTLQEMFPDICDCLAACNVDIDKFPRQCYVQVDEGIVRRIYNDDGDIYALSEKQINEMIEEKRAREVNVLLSRYPYRADENLLSVVDSFKDPRRTNEDIRQKVLDGSYFGNRIEPVGWWGSFTDAGGYANMNREITQRLHNHYIIPYLQIYPTISQVDRKTESLLRNYSKLRPKGNNHPYVYAFTPMPHERHPGKRIFFTMMETSTLHPDFTKYCNEYSDEVWVPSEANKRLFASNGVRRKIRVIPLGIDGDLYFGTDIDRNKIDLSECDTLFGRNAKDGVASFKFLTVIQWNFRKGFDALLKSFVKSFTHRDDVCLVISTQYSKEYVLNDLKKFLPRVSDLPQILLYNRVIPIDCMPNIYDACDCYIHLSRGEGFSLTQIEAGARGLPIISCNHSGMTEYLREDNSYPIECNDREPCSPSLSAISYFYQGQSLWKLGDRQVESAASMMNHVIKNYSEAQEKARIFRSDVQEKYTWDVVAQRIAEALRS